MEMLMDENREVGCFSTQSCSKNVPGPVIWKRAAFDPSCQYILNKTSKVKDGGERPCKDVRDFLRNIAEEDVGYYRETLASIKVFN